MIDARPLVEQQALDDGLWFVAERAPEAYLQTALRTLHMAVENDTQWRPIGTAPQDGTHILAYWPLHPFDDDGNMNEAVVIGGVRAVTFRNGNGWIEPDYLDATGAWFGDDCCYAPVPTHWLPLPPAPEATFIRADALDRVSAACDALIASATGEGQ